MTDEPQAGTAIATQSSIDAEAIAGYCAALRAGCSERTAARAIGRDRTTVWRWRQRAREHRGAGIESVYTEFLDKYEHAEAEMLAEVEANVLAASKRDWKAGAFVLKHRNPTTYNRDGAGEVASEVAEQLLHRIRHRCRPETYQDVIENALTDAIEVRGK